MTALGGRFSHFYWAVHRIDRATLNFYLALPRTVWASNLRFLGNGNFTGTFRLNHSTESLT
jgi:hypothetical protein